MGHTNVEQIVNNDLKMLPDASPSIYWNLALKDFLWCQLCTADCSDDATRRTSAADWEFRTSSRLDPHDIRHVFPSRGRPEHKSPRLQTHSIINLLYRCSFRSQLMIQESEVRDGIVLGPVNLIILWSDVSGDFTDSKTSYFGMFCLQVGQYKTRCGVT